LSQNGYGYRVGDSHCVDQSLGCSANLVYPPPHLDQHLPHH
jgi:hypothetical protein